MSTDRWRFAIDRGGTFTDVVGIDPEGKLHCLKLLSSSPLYADPAAEAIRRLTGREPPFTVDTVGTIRLGTTVATNALLQRLGGRLLLCVTQGFRDLLEIGYQQREDLFGLCVTRRAPLYRAVCEVPERIGPDGTVERPIDRDALRARLSEFDPGHYDAVAVVLVHSWLNPEHELVVEELLNQMGFREVFLSHRVSPEIKVIPRGNATVVDAYLAPVIRRYTEQLRQTIGEVPVEFFTSSGGTVRAEAFSGRQALLSGPAGGAVAVAALAEALNMDRVVGFDMGGTSTDVCRWVNGLAMVYERKIAGIEVKTEMVDINTIASGGGSVLWFDGERMRVGPRSAGSEPGPACYGFGGPATITDANLIAGRLVPDSMPRTFGPDRRSPLDRDASLKVLGELAEEIYSSTGRQYSPQALALGYLRIANEMMANAIKEMTVAKGLDVRDFTLVAFGGAAGQHACFIARSLEMPEVVFHPMGGLLSALGIAMARALVSKAWSFLRPFTEESMVEVREAFERVESQLGLDEGFVVQRQICLRARGSEGEITVGYGNYQEVLQQFVQRYRELFGFFEPGTEIEVSTLRIRAYKRQTLLDSILPQRVSLRGQPEPVSWQTFYDQDRPLQVPVYRWEDLPEGYTLHGPLMVINPFTTVVVPEGFCLQVDRGGLLRARAVSKARAEDISLEGPDPVLLEVFHRAFTSVATEMGEVLQRTARSVNIKERQDYSCAVFSPEAALVANAPHIPVHLGAMAETVRAVAEHWASDMRSGDIYLTNNPYRGGSHLPDLTVVHPVFSEQGQLLFYTAARGHHPDIGGKSPGSIPAECSHIDEEGVVIDNFLLMRDGHLREEALLQLFRNHPYPPRAVEDILYDLVAQIGACRRGARRLIELTERYTYPLVRAYMDFIQDNGRRAIQRAIEDLLQDSDRIERTFEDFLDDGSPLRVRILASRGDQGPELVLDFTGTAEQHLRDNLNAPLAVVKAAVLYVLRSMVQDDIPLNSGCLEPVEVVVPEGSLLNPTWPAPVASGNVETSQRVVDLLLGALGISAGSQGSMNNLLFQVQAERPYYETIGGGYGATAQCRGGSAVQVHMTNTRGTDPEVLEWRHPGVRLRRFGIRRGSGGRGMYPGGDGIIRDIQFLKDTELTLVTERRRVPAFGLEGGQPGRPGVNLLWVPAEPPRRIGHRVSLRVPGGTRLIIKTPGGGGYGTPQD